MKKVYIVTTYTGTVISYLIRNIKKTPYAHVSLSLNEDLQPMYSFGRLNPKTPIFAGFVEENINEGLYAIRTNTRCRVYSLDVTNEQYESLKINIKEFGDEREKYTYDAMALVLVPMKRARKAEYKYICSQFVHEMLESSDINIVDKNSYEVVPNDFYDLHSLNLEYEGLLSEYPNRHNLILQTV